MTKCTKSTHRQHISHDDVKNLNVARRSYATLASMLH
jgi:hypothetical protein